METETKIFDDYHVDCNDCKHYWDDSCDGVPVGASKRPCTSFSASRKVNLPKQVKDLQERVKWLNISVWLLIINELLEMIGGFVK